MENKKPKIEEVLDRTLPIENFGELDGHDNISFKALLSYVMSCRKAKAKKITTKVMLAWDEMDKKEKAVLTEHYSKLQLVQIGMTVAMTEPLDLPVPSLFGKMIDGDSEFGKEIMDRLKNLFDKEE